MRHFTIALAALALSISAASAAPDDHNRGRDRGHAAQQHNEGPRGGTRNPAAVQQGNRGAGNRFEHQPNVARQHGQQHGRQNAFGATQNRPDVNRPNVARGPARDNNRAATLDQRRNFGNRNFGDRNFDNRGRDNAGRDFDRREGGAHGRVDRGRVARGRVDRGRVIGRNGRDERFGYSRDARGGRHFDYRGRAFVSVRAPAYRYPRGYHYRRWYRGERLPLFFIADAYFIDYDWIGLPPPPYGYRWVRYGPDALLVDIYTGDVADVVYGVFY